MRGERSEPWSLKLALGVPGSDSHMNGTVADTPVW